mmetsp:Transcript_13531/g.23041  ORF Transcript_13531/g.23041 Transcript_13531/m.23041 type:complete len:91 (+) Transcript_13531:267-539(+)
MLTCLLAVSAWSMHSLDSSSSTASTRTYWATPVQILQHRSFPVYNPILVLEGSHIAIACPCVPTNLRVALAIPIHELVAFCTPNILGCSP